MAIIEVKDLTKKYKLKERKEGFLGTLKTFFAPKYYYKTAVDNVSFKINKGECVGYIGENGAGKSTTIKMLTGILYPTSGEVLVNGVVPNKNKMKNNMNISTVFGQRSQLWWDLPVVESFKFNKKLYEISDKTYNENMNRYKEMLNIEELLNIPVRNLSLGQRMKFEIAVAFLHNPKVVYLDEPTIGLDVLVKEDIRKFIKEQSNEKDTTIILTTHDLKDIEEVCDRIIVIDTGKILHDGNIGDFINEFGKERSINFSVKNVKELLVESINGQIMSLENITDSEIKITFDKNKATANDVINLVSKYCEIIDISIEEPNLESIVRQIYRSNKHEEVK